jgi:hypothetical protein
MKEALKLALEALETESDIYRENDDDGAPEYILEAITALRLAIDVQNMASESTYKAALAQPAQELTNIQRHEQNVQKLFGTAQPAQEPVAWGYRICEFCGCHTNAKARACCDAGRDADKALAQPAQEPVAWVTKRNVIVDGLWEEEITFSEFDDGGDPVYYTPQQRRWVGLTGKQRDAITEKVIGFNNCCGWEDDYAKALEAKLKEKNT